MSANSIRLITRADDAGSSREANFGVHAALTRGLSRNASIMAPGPWLAEAATLLAGLEGVDFGLHVTLNSEWRDVKWGPVSPVAEVPALVDADGYFLPSTEEAHAAQWPVDQVVREVRAQLDLLRRVGFRLRYLDEHMAIGWVQVRHGDGTMGPLHEVLAELAAAEGLLCVRDRFAFLPRIQDGPVELADRWLQEYEAGREGAVHVQVLHPCLALADSLLVGVEPRTFAEELPRREAETAAITDPAFLRACRDLPLEPLRYSEALVGE